MLVLAKLGLTIGSGASVWTGVQGLSNDNVTQIIVALIGAAGVIVASWNGRRLKRVERAVNAAKATAREGVDELTAVVERERDDREHDDQGRGDGR